MKLIQTNNDQLEIKTSGVSTVIFGILFVIFGIVAGAWPFIAKDTPWWVSLIGLGLAGLGAFAIFGATKRSVVLRRVGSSEITETKLIGGKTTSSTFTNDQVVSIGLETATEYTSTSTTNQSTAGDPGQRQRVSTLYVLLKDNSEIVLATERSGANSVAVNGINLSSFGAAPLSKEAQQIADFFGVNVAARTLGEASWQDISHAVSAIRDGLTQETPAPTTPQPTVVAATPPVAPPAASAPQPPVDPNNSRIPQ